ncbi:UDP-N-acetylmuramoylalanine--D-glutamate ligase [uncultured archaeon]|nr:UDP-N-acetylmuramoylalanine--D-glutamate ligase [uncultured archaeon]
MQFKSSHRVAVLDLTHGGAVIARKLRNIVSEITAIDVYKTMDAAELDALENCGIKTSREPLDASDFDLIIAPVHLDSNYPMLKDALSNNIPVLSHHVAAGQILSGYNLKNKTLVEITGTKAKTSTAILLAQILSGEKKVVSHTSRGIEDWSTGKSVRKGLSITPASILLALDAVEEAGIEFEVFISEISLGGTGCADIGVITTIANDYKIASGTRLASDAKRQMILNAKPKSSIVVNKDALRFFGACRRDLNIISFTESIDASCSVYYEDEKTIAYYLDKKHGRICLPDAQGYDINAYKTAFACATAAALAMNIGADVIGRALCDFGGAEGRMKKTSLAGRTLIDNSNSGMDIRVAEKALEFSKAQGERIVMVLGEEAKEVCEGLDPSGVEQFIQKHLDELAALVLVGERMKPLVNTEDNIHYAGNLAAGIELAKKMTHEKDIILSCVKCFR